MLTSLYFGTAALQLNFRRSFINQEITFMTNSRQLYYSYFSSGGILGYYVLYHMFLIYQLMI